MLGLDKKLLFCVQNFLIQNEQLAIYYLLNLRLILYNGSFYFILHNLVFMLFSVLFNFSIHVFKSFFSRFCIKSHNFIYRISSRLTLLCFEHTFYLCLKQGGRTSPSALYRVLLSQRTSLGITNCRLPPIWTTLTTVVIKQPGGNLYFTSAETSYCL